MASRVGLVWLVRHRVGQIGDAVDLLLQLGLHLPQRVVDVDDLLVQVAANLPQALVDGARALFVDQVDAVGELLTQLALGDLVLDLLQDRAGVHAGNTRDDGRSHREERADVAGAVHQARPEEEPLPGAQALHDVLVLRVGQVGQFGGQLQVGAFAVPQLRALGVLGASWEAPGDLDPEQQAFGVEEGNRGRYAFLTVQLSQGRTFPDGRDVEGTDCPYPSQVSAGVDTDHIN
ncbi:hypothetical protein D3C81_1269460 [compost metagenome]